MLFFLFSRRESFIDAASFLRFSYDLGAASDEEEPRDGNKVSREAVECPSRYCSHK